jgi:transcriptional regulator with XRE-family HTH domain
MSKVTFIGDEYDVDMSAIKMEQIASHLVGLLRHKKISRSELAKELGWRKSRVTKVLSGDENLTIKTMTVITQKLGYDFDVIFHNKNYDKPKQPWQIDRERRNLLQVAPPQLTSRPFHYEIQTGQQVVNDVLAGHEKELYISVESSPSVKGHFIEISSNDIFCLPNTTATYINQEIKVDYEHCE